MTVNIHPAASSASSSHWRDYFLACWEATHTKALLPLLSPRVLSVARTLFLLKAYSEVRFIRLFERWIFPNRKRKALLIGIKAEDDPENVALQGPHSDVAAMKRLLISEFLQYFFRSWGLMDDKISMGIERRTSR